MCSPLAHSLWRLPQLQSLSLLVALRALAPALLTRPQAEARARARGVVSQKSPSGNLPGSRVGYYGGYDPISRQVVVFSDATGGEDYENYLAAYSADESRWTTLDAKGEWPEARYAPAVLFDPIAGRLIIFGGTDAYAEIR